MKVIKYSSYRVEVNPERQQPADHARMRAALADISNQIKRHVDGVARVTVHWDTETVCSHCGYPWEVLTAEDIERYPDWAEQPGDGPGLPACCEAAQAEWRAEQAAKGGA